MRDIEIDTYGVVEISGVEVLLDYCADGCFVWVSQWGLEVAFSSKGYFFMPRPDFLWKSMCYFNHGMSGKRLHRLHGANNKDLVLTKGSLGLILGNERRYK